MREAKDGRSGRSEQGDGDSGSDEGRKEIRSEETLFVLIK